jgi:CxxC motif-containing protein (DUF1111 family)
MRTFLCLLSVFVALLAFLCCGTFSSAEIEADVTGPFGEPISGLEDFELDRFQHGREVFARRFAPSTGLGPHFNAVACSSCHSTPAVGGSAQRYRDFFILARLQPDGKAPKYYASCTAETNRDVDLCLPSIVVPNYGPSGTIAEPVAADVEHPAIPSSPDAIVARRNAPPVFGLGLFRLVSDEEILSRADPDDANADGISGRVNRIPAEESRIGRFGYKCQTASIEAFNRGALNNQMGITSDSIELGFGDDFAPRRESLLEQLFGMRTAHAQVPEPKDRITDFDGVADPELRRSELMDLVFFQEHLAAPRRGAVSPGVERGAEVFERIGCAGCHAASLRTSRGLIHPYTDLLIHDMGPDLADGIVMAEASGSEFRTQPLWGLCQHAPFLHDGRADTVNEAILAHGGEAQASRQRYADLTPGERDALRRFLESL